MEHTHLLAMPLAMMSLMLPVRSTPAVAGASAGLLTLAKGGHSDYTIVHAAAPEEQKAAVELQRYLKQISGAELPAVPASESVPAQSILVGAVTGSGAGLGVEGIEMRTVGERLLLRGGSPRATLYAVYTFLEEKLGCRFYAPGVEKVPRQNTIRIPSFVTVEHPALESREILQVDAQGADWATKNKVNGPIGTRGGHSLYGLVPPARCFAEHPEFYPLIKGKRTPDDIWFCFTNPQLPHVIADALIRKMQSQDDPLAIWDASQGDWYSGCECPQCQAAFKEEGEAWSGVLLRCLNQVAGEIARRCPGRRVSTFAYMHSEKPPAKTKPAKNLVICLIHWRRCDWHALTECQPQEPFMENLRRWNAITTPGNLYIWDYIANLRALQMPWPNVSTLVPNVKTYYANGVRGLFLEGNYVSAGGDLSRLKMYLLAKALWNPNIDPKAVMADFMAGYYGRAAKAMTEYVKLMERAARQEDFHPNCIAHGPEKIEPHLFKPETGARAEALFDEAERAAENEAVRVRVREDRIGLLFVRLYAQKPLAPANGRLVPLGDPRYAAWFDAFLATLGNRALAEFGTRHEQIRAITIRNGGPLVTLENEALKVEVCPNLGGRIYALIDRRTGRNLLHVATITEKGYPLTGGYDELSPYAPEIYTAKLTHDGAAPVLTLTAPLGTGQDGYAPKVENVRVICLEPGKPEITITSALKNISPTKRSVFLKASARYAGNATWQTTVVKPVGATADTALASKPTAITLRLADAKDRLLLVDDFAAGGPGEIEAQPNPVGSLDVLFSPAPVELEPGETRVLLRHTLRLEPLP